MNTVPSPADYQQPVVEVRRSTSGLAVASLVLGIVALLSSIIPIINNISFILAVIGLIFGIVGFVVTHRGTKGGAGLAVAGIVLNVVACILVLATQSCYSAALDQAAESLQTGGVAAVATSTGTDAQAAELPVGSSVTLSNGLVVTVESVDAGYATYSGEPVTGVRVRYANEGTEDVSFNMFDWKGQDTQGVQDSATILLSADDSLNSGTLVPGGSVAGMVYFDGELTKVLYFTSAFSSKAAAVWTVV